MKTDIKERWVAALRSGEYEQGKGALHEVVGERDKFCCLGVLCKIAAEDGAIPEPGRDGPYYVYAGGSGVLSTIVQEWAGMPSSWGRLPNGVLVDGNPTLVDLNDGGKSFAEIADVIEEYF